MADFDFPETPTGSLGDLWRAVVRLLPQLGGRGSVIRGASIGTDETLVAHGMKFAPKMGIPVATSNATVWETRAPDTKLGYFAASTACTANVRFIP
jgi:hypothetical protein